MKYTKAGYPTEHSEQVMFADFMRDYFKDVLWTASAGGMRTSIGSGCKMKAAGYVAGCPDVMVFEARSKYHGLMIEMKTAKGGTWSLEQKDWAVKARLRGYCYVVCAGCGEAKNIVREYLAGNL